MNSFSKPLIDVLSGRVPSQRPVWLMRQAGRYLPEYRELRKKAGNFLDLCLTPEWAAEITLQPLRRFDMDAAILFADILLVPLALGVALEFKEGEGPVLEKIESEQALDKLAYDEKKVAAVFETIKRVKEALPQEKTLIGFCGSPFTVAAYMIDGNSKSNFSRTKNIREKNPEFLEKIISCLIDASELYVNAQIKAGAEVIQLFDSWAGFLSPKDFSQFVIKPTKELVLRLKKKFPSLPIIGFPREAKEGYGPYIRETGVDCVSIDHFVSLDFAKADLQIIKPLQGNLDPALLVEGGDHMKKALEKIMTTLGPKHIVNLGHGVVPTTPPEHVGDMIKFVHEFGV